jgi:hypothetical protein
MKRINRLIAIVWFTSTVPAISMGATDQTAAHPAIAADQHQSNEVEVSEQFLPPNTLHLRKAVQGSGIDEAQFNAIIDQIEAFYQPIVSSHSANLLVGRVWESDSVNAQASQNGNNWIILVAGGIARAPEMTADGFALVMCHEMGHHIGGYPFAASTTWATAEGQADYFATHSCARDLWRDDDNSEYSAQVHPTAKAKCDTEWAYQNERELCYRVTQASQALADLLGALEDTTVSYDTMDPSQVTSTYKGHPDAQCRLDTYLVGSLCNIEYDRDNIPGKFALIDLYSIYSEQEAALQTCARASHDLGVYGVNEAYRPRCWHRPNLTSHDITIPANH